MADLPPAIAGLARSQGLWLRRREYRSDLDGIVRAIKVAAPDLGDQPRRRAVLISVGAMAVVAAAVAFAAALFVNHPAGSNSGQPTLVSVGDIGLVCDVGCD